MDTRTFDALTRRASLLTLGTAGLAVLTHPMVGAAKKKKRKKNKGNVNQRCKKQVGPCIDFVNAECAPGEPECEEFIACCSLLGSCNFSGFVACFEEVQQIPEKSARLLR